MAAWKSSRSPGPPVKRALAGAGAAEGETDDGAADADQALRRVVDDAVVQRAAELGMRRRDHRDRARRSGGFVDARLEAAGRAVEVADAGRVMVHPWAPTKSPTSAAKVPARVTVPMCPVPSSRATVVRVM